MAGVLLSAAGVYLLNVSRAQVSPWAPLATLVTDRGQRYTMLAALFYAPSVITIKQAILASNTAMGTFGPYLAASLVMTPIVLRTSARHFGASRATGRSSSRSACSPRSRRCPRGTRTR